MSFIVYRERTLNLSTFFLLKDMIRETQPVIAIDTTLLPLSNLKSIPQKDEAIPDNIGIIIGSITGVFVLFAMLLLVFLNRRFAQRKIITRHSSVGKLKLQ